MVSLDSVRPADKPVPPNVRIDLADPADMFAKLCEARQRSDAAEGRRLTVELRKAGWVVLPVLPRGEFAAKGGAR